MWDTGTVTDIRTETSDLQAGSKVVLVGAGINLLLSLIKGIVGFLTGSVALISDAGHSLGDLATDVIAWFSLRLSRQPRDADHPYGHGKFETMGTLSVALFLVATGVFLLSESIDAILHPTETGAWALVAAAASIGLNEWLYHYSMRVARRIRSGVLEANAWHHRTDSLTSVVAFAGIGLNLLGLPAWEGWMAALISCFVGWIGVRLGYQAVQDLLDRSVEPDLIGKLQQALEQIDGVVDCHELRARRMGGDVLVDLHVQVPPDITVSHGHQIAEQVRSQLLAADPAVTEVLVHIDPEADDKYDTPQVQDVDDPENLVRTVATSVEGVQSVSHVFCHFIHGCLEIQLHIEVEPTLRVLEASAIAGQVRKALEAQPDIHKVDVHLELDDSHDVDAQI
jgi:cation diffusion facilitator family transporter